MKKVMTNCRTRFWNILRRIRRGTTRFQAGIVLTQLERAIAKHRETCDESEADFLTLLSQTSFGRLSIPDAILALKDLVTRASPLARLEAYQLLARLTLLTEPLATNLAYRQNALELSRYGYPGEKFVILVHWLSALVKVREFDKAGEMLPEVDTALAELDAKILRRQEIHEVHSRLYTHKAKILFWQARGAAPEEARVLIEEGRELYRRAIERDKSNDHRRVNGQIEFAEELIHLHRETGAPTLVDAAHIMESAERSLDAHVCPGCPAYFQQVQGEFFLVQGDDKYGCDLEDAIASWEASSEWLQKSVATYKQSGFAEIADPLRLFTETRERLAMATQPRGIFLSHRGVDSEFVREFKEVLEILKFEPWLDESSLHAGMPLEDSLVQGFKTSCAAVFFITPSFKESSWLESEIRYAMAEYRERGNDFAIIPLVFRDPDGSEGVVPELLRQFVYKQPGTQLAALKELIHALPLIPGTPLRKGSASSTKT